MQVSHFFKEEVIAHLNVLQSCYESIEETREVGKTILVSIKEKLDKTDFFENYPDMSDKFEETLQNPSHNIVDDISTVIQMMESVLDQV